MKAVDLLAEEVPVVCHVPEETRWVVVTTQRVLYCNGDRIHHVMLNDIADIPISLKDWILKPLRKQRFRVLTQAGDLHVIECEPGRPTHAMETIIHAAWRMTPRSRRADEVERTV